MSAKLAYLAGIIDGEGTITLTKQSTGASFRSIELTVSNTHKGLIDWLRAEFGGRVRIRRGRKSHYKPLYEWRISSDRALSLLKRVRRHLRIKRPRADLICDRWAKVTRRAGRYSETERTAKVVFEASVMSL